MRDTVSYCAPLGSDVREMGWYCNRFVGQTALAPQKIDRRIDEQLHQERREEAADHRGGDALHHVSPRPERPHDRDEAEEGAGDGHDLRADALDGTVEDCLVEILTRVERAGGEALVVREVEIEQHEDASLGVEPEEGDEADPDTDGHVVTE